MSDRAALMREAHKLFRDMRRFDETYTFGRAIAWAAHNARARQERDRMSEIASAIRSMEFQPRAYGAGRAREGRGRAKTSARVIMPDCAFPRVPEPR